MRDDPYDFQPINKNTGILAQRKTYFFVLAALSLFFLVLAWHSDSKYKETSTCSASIQVHLPIHAGEIHYSRVPWQYWEHRILLIKAMGLNSLSVYVMWNHHERERGEFDFETEDRNLVGFLKLAKKHDMKVLLRPGPYICAEWDFGGLPARLLGIEGIEVRSDNAIYEQEVKVYFSALAPVIIPFLFANNGPIIMIQIENQLGYYSNSSTHSAHLLKMWKELGANSEFYYADAYENWKKQYWKGAHIGISGGISHSKYHLAQISKLRSKDSLIFGGEIYSGWLTHWGQEKWGKKSAEQYKKELAGLVLSNRSASIYVACGGTNFGLTAGANGYSPQVFNFFQYMPHITSYDYDAPINQQGRITEKYSLIRSIFQQYYKRPIATEIPEAIKSIPIPTFLAKIKAHLWANLPQPLVVGGKITYFQSNELKMYNQGIAVYETFLKDKGIYTFEAVIHDFAMVFVEQTFVTSLMRKQRKASRFQCQCLTPPCQLRILVEAMGHINFGIEIGKDRKGLIQIKEKDNRQAQFAWNIYKIEMGRQIFEWVEKSPTELFPVVYQAEFQVNELGDTFLDMSDYKKGYVWINQRLIGRYWNIGPQKRLYCPGIWLRKGMNKITILEMLQQKYEYIKGYKSAND